MPRNATVVLSALVVVLSLSARPTVADMTYLALGDSLAFGETNFAEIASTLMGAPLQSSGDRGYVGRFADHLGQLNGGVRPDVISLGVDGENSKSFTTGSVDSSIDPLFKPGVYAVNSNYKRLLADLHHGHRSSRLIS